MSSVERLKLIHILLILQYFCHWNWIIRVFVWVKGAENPSLPFPSIELVMKGKSHATLHLHKNTSSENFQLRFLRLQAQTRPSAKCLVRIAYNIRMWMAQKKRKPCIMLSALNGRHTWMALHLARITWENWSMFWIALIYANLFRASSFKHTSFALMGSESSFSRD